ncbi:MAG TPA: gluconate 2-dehydrogenase subunit 3 family protein [Gemmatimonadetes bacterium]|nr:gluconate 2-dehydrogenase subunit 3 family protein [Gemmatimonadota bacterium]
MINRRDAIKSLVISVGGGSLLSACGGQVTLGALTPGAPPRFYGEREMAVVSRVSDLLLPRTETPGALDVHVPALLDQLMADWANNETQTAHRAALAALDTRLRASSRGDFLDATHVVAQQALTTVDAAAFAGDPTEGYRALKGLISQAYFATEEGALEERQWVAVPGRWEPCVDRS